MQKKKITLKTLQARIDLLEKRIKELEAATLNKNELPVISSTYQRPHSTTAGDWRPS